MIAKYTKNRLRLLELMKSGGNSKFITIADAEKALGVSRAQARSTLFAMTKSGWLKSIKSGLYIPTPIESPDPKVSSENLFVLASYLFPECYIGGWSAANFLGLTDQIFSNIWVMTTKDIRKSEQKVGGHSFCLKTIDADYMYGTKSEWIDSAKVLFSNPTKTVVDYLNFPESFSANSMVDVFTQYIVSNYKDMVLLKTYTDLTKNKTVFKRLGFLLERYLPEEAALINYCKQSISSGYSKFSSLSVCDRILLRWNLRVPNMLMSDK